MTDVRTFKAATMQEALDIVRREMGSDAVILQTRQVARRRLLPWIKSKEEVEITAGLGVNIRQPAGRRQTAAQKTAATGGNLSMAATRAARKTSEPTINGGGGSGNVRSGVSDAGVELQIGPEARRSPAAIRPQQPFSPGRNTLNSTHPSQEQSAVASSAIAASLQPAKLQADAFAASTSEFAAKLDSIQKMITQLGRARDIGGLHEIPGELFHLYTELIDADVEDELARNLIFRLRNGATPGQLKNADAARALLTALVEAEIRCCEPIRPTPGRRKVVALVGPTGVGKTTTIAKLAANFRLRDGIRMGLLTVDTYRVAAVEQLRTYAEIIDLPMKVVTSPQEMRRALDELMGLDLVLIDTAGRSPRDELKIQELKRLLAEADVDEVHLVLSLTGSVKSLEATAQKFTPAGVTSLILTKLDEAAEMGTLYSIARKINLPVSYLTTGQNVPDDIEPTNASRMARLILGRDRLLV